MEASAAYAAVHFRRRSRCTSPARPPVPREPRPTVRRRLGRRHADVRRSVQLSERAERADLPASAATEHGVGRHSNVAARDAFYFRRRRRRRRVADRQPGVTPESTQLRCVERCNVICRWNNYATRCIYAATQGKVFLFRYAQCLAAFTHSDTDIRLCH